MNRIRVGVTALGLTAAALVVARPAWAQEITGRVAGRVTDRDTGAALGGVTVIMQGPQGEDATLTDDRGDYTFTSLPVGTYVIRFYVATASAQVEQSGVIVSADKMVRVNAKIASTVQEAAQQTYVINGKAPSIDVGSARVGAEFDENFTLHVPLNRTYGDVIERAPGAFVDGSGNVSIAGATGLENTYLVNGLNVTGLQYGNLESGASSIGGGTNLPLEFLTQIDVSSGGYQAEYGGAMGGVINTVLKSGSNEFHGSAFGFWSPYWMASDPKVVRPLGSSLASLRKPDFDDSIGVELGGPIIKNKLFFWFGFAPRITDSHVFRLTYSIPQDPLNPGQPSLDSSKYQELTAWRARIDETHRTYYYAGTVDWTPVTDHRLTLAIVGTPSFNQDLQNQYGINPISGNPRWAVESLTKTNTDVSAHWVSKLFDRHWQIDAMGGMHSEYLYERSPYADLNGTSELQYFNTNLWDLEHAPGCEPISYTDPTTHLPATYQPCPTTAQGYQTGGFGTITKSTGYRWSAELKSTHLFEAGGRHELKYGWHMDLSTLDLDRRYSGGSFVQLYPGSNGSFSTQTFFTLRPGEHATDYTSGLSNPVNLLYPPDYRDELNASVKSLSNAFFLQESYSPKPLPNLTLNAGLRLDWEKLYDTNDIAFLNTNNWAPRLGAVYDPFNDGRSKVSVSFGRYYEAVPLDIAARYFGGENFLQRQNVPLSNCSGAMQNAYAWPGNSNWRMNCMTPAAGEADMHALATFNSEYAQPSLQGQYHNEVVATLEREVLEDLTVRIDYQHRWLGQIIEDGYGPGFGGLVLANPGHVPQDAIDTANAQVRQAQAMVTANPNNAAAQSALANAQYNLATLQQFKDAPEPERTYDAVTLSVNKRFSKNWLTHASYTYSRLVGNYEGLYQNETNYAAPNGGNAYDAPELYVNQYGRLPNDRPHLFHLDGFYGHDVGRLGHFTVGLSFSARSGMPRNYIANLVPQSPYQLVFLLPRGDAGRTPTVTQLDGRISYSRSLAPKVQLEAFIDLFNVLNQQTTLMTDDNYTFDAAPPIVNGTPADLKFAKNVAGAPLSKNPNYGQSIAYQQPFHGRLGLRLTF